MLAMQRSRVLLTRDKVRCVAKPIHQRRPHIMSRGMLHARLAPGKLNFIVSLCVRVPVLALACVRACVRACELQKLVHVHASMPDVKRQTRACTFFNPLTHTKRIAHGS